MIEIKEYGPVFDLFIEALKEYSKDGQVEVETSLHPEAVGLAYDLQALFYLHEKVNTEITIHDKGKTALNIDKEGVDAVFRLDLKKDLKFDIDRDRSYEKKCDLTADNSSEVRVMAREQKRNYRSTSLSELLESRLPLQRDPKIDLYWVI